MITESTIYWITRLDYLHGLAIGITILFMIIVLALIVTAGLTYAEGDKKSAEYALFRLAPVSALIAAIGILGIVFIPTTREMAMIKVIPALANSKFVAEELPSDAQRLYKLGIQAIEEKLVPKKESKK